MFWWSELELPDVDGTITLPPVNLAYSMIMNRTSRRAFRLVPIALSSILGAGWLTFTVAEAASTRVPASQSADGQWGDELVAAAERGDSDRLKQLLAVAPAQLDASDVARLRSRVEGLASHRADASKTNAQELATREAALAKHQSEGKLIDAMVDAANVHELASPDQWTEFASAVSMQTLISSTEQAALAAEADGDLLYAQELTFRLKGLAENLEDKALTSALEAKLRDLNTRVGLIAKYAPREFYELRMNVLRRLEPDREIDPYNELFADEWKEVLKDASPQLLLKALKTAADSHITDTGWQPLIEGGLEAMRGLAQSEQLAENFDGLKDPERVAAFLSAVDRIAARKGDSPAGARDAIVEILSENERTLQLPQELVVLEFGDGATANLSEDFGDDYSSIIWPEALRRFRQQMEGDFVGVGVLIRYDDKHEIMVVNPLEGSPAARAGVRPGDRIVKVDGNSTAGWSLNKAVENITGPAGDPVRVELRREDTDEPITVKLVRQSIPMQSVNGWWKRMLDESGSPVWDWYADPDAGIGYTRITSFNDDTVRDFVQAVESMRAERPLRGLIVDLRGNPGGLLPAAAGFANLFIKRGPLVSIEDRNGKKVDELHANPSRARYAGMPLVVLVNGESASASEIVSGALQAYDAAIVVGTRSFGKGSVQTVQPVTDGRTTGAVKVTTQYYVLPPEPGAERGRWVHKRAGKEQWGVEPDIEVSLSPSDVRDSVMLRTAADFIDAGAMDLPTVDNRPNVDDLVSKGVDPQVEMAVLLLESKILAEAGSSRVADRRRSRTDSATPVSR